MVKGIRNRKQRNLLKEANSNTKGTMGILVRDLRMSRLFLTHQFQQKSQSKDEQIADCSFTPSSETVDAIPESITTKMDNGKQENGLDTGNSLEVKLIIKTS